jgi:hypothetical protein
MKYGYNDNDLIMIACPIFFCGFGERVTIYVGAECGLFTAWELVSFLVVVDDRHCVISMITPCMNTFCMTWSSILVVGLDSQRTVGR